MKQLLCSGNVCKQLILMLLTGLAVTLHAKVEVTARFEPSRIAIGSTAKYSVEIVDTSTDAFTSVEQITSLPIPPISGLTFRGGRTSSSKQAKIINGRAEHRITQQLIFDAIPESTGSYTIPAYLLDYKGELLRVPAATLTVIGRSKNGQPMENEPVFLTLEAPDKFYVGQTEAVTLKLYLASDLSLGEYRFERDADGFIVDDGALENRTESSEFVNGQRYRVLNWPLTITPVSVGKKDMNFQCELIVQMPGSVDPYSNNIFDDLFGRIKKFNVYTKPAQIDVLPLPTENQPKNFSGAIGQFNISVSTDTRITRVNEPIMLSLKVSGAGNFDRIQGPELPKTSSWRSYPPESVYEADSVDTLKGTKRFDYIFVPEKAGKLELPEVSFSFFDPDVEKYIDLTSPAISVEVSPSNMPAAPVTTPLNPKAQTTTPSQTSLTKSLSPEELLLTLDYQPREGRNLPTGSILTPGFYGLNISLLIALSTIGGIGYIRKKNSHDKNYLFIKNAKQELKAVLKKADGSNGPAFYGYAQTAVRLATGIRLKQDLRSADLNELEMHFTQLKLPEAATENARKLFHTADNLRFSGQAQTVDLSEARTQLNSLLKAL